MSPRTEEQFEEIRGQKRMLIINTALELFANNGFHSTSIQQIARQAGISKGLIYNYFESKEALMHAILDKGIEEMLSIFDPNKDGILEKHELELFIHESFKMIEENMKFWKLYFSISLQPAIYNLVKEKIIQAEPLMSMTTDYFKKRGVKNPEMESYLFGALMDGIAVQYIMNPERYPIKQIKASLIEKYCKIS